MGPYLVAFALGAGVATAWQSLEASLQSEWFGLGMWEFAAACSGAAGCLGLWLRLPPGIALVVTAIGSLLLVLEEAAFPFVPFTSFDWAWFGFCAGLLTNGAVGLLRAGGRARKALRPPSRRQAGRE